MDRFLDEHDNPMPQRDRSASPSINSLLYGDPKHRSSHDPLKSGTDDLQTAHIFDLVQKVVGSSADLSSLKLNSQLSHPTATNPASVSINPELNDASQCAENLVYSANFTQIPLAENATVFPSPTALPAAPEMEASSDEPLAKRLKPDTDSNSNSSELLAASSPVFAEASACEGNTTKTDMTNHTDHCVSDSAIMKDQCSKIKDSDDRGVLVVENLGDHLGNVGLSISSVGSSTKCIGDSSISSLSTIKSSTTVSASASLLPTPPAGES